ncbi:M15 family metallopeptidase [Cellulomonas telluris]|uniref:M15 family metallopeptidase n=1 Tax=Cellulomonas telluris TaxID=2306636 RepID=UPI0010A81817|nr:M15 family metallopeptidase [Cellulomonas telluris]
MLSTGAVVVTATAEEPPARQLAGAQDEPEAQPAEDRAALARTEQLRSEAVEVASDAIEQASAVRAEAEQAAVAPEVLAELDAATAELQAAITQVDVAPLTPTDALPDRERAASRSSVDREESALADEDGGSAATPSPGSSSAPSADPSALPTDPEAADATPTAEPEGPEAAEAAEAADGETTTVPDSGDPATAPLREALDRVTRAADAARASADQKRAEAAAAAAAAQAAADEAARVEAEKAAQRAAWKASLQGFANGRVPDSALCGVGFDSSVRLRCDAAEALEALDAAFTARFGHHLDVTDSYRSYAAQVACRANKGSLCARPGTSNHGMGIAVDVAGDVQSFGTAEHQWMRENAPAYDWTLPEWARAGGSKPEPWHWEYVG